MVNTTTVEWFVDTLVENGSDEFGLWLGAPGDDRPELFAWVTDRGFLVCGGVWPGDSKSLGAAVAELHRRWSE